MKPSRLALIALCLPALLLLALWLRSYWQYDCAYLRAPARGLTVTSERGSLSIVWIEYPPITWTSWSSGLQAIPFQWPSPPGPWRRLIRFTIERTDFDLSGITAQPQFLRKREVLLPHWPVVLLLCLLPLAWTRLARRWQHPGFCPHCGYDLRGTPTACPECGAKIISAKSIKST